MKANSNRKINFSNITKMSSDRDSLLFSVFVTPQTKQYQKYIIV